MEAYCARSGVPPSTLSYWRRRSRKSGGVSRKIASQPVPGFARVEVVPDRPAGAGITAVVRTPGGVGVELSGLDGATVVGLLEAVLERLRR